MVKQRMLKTIPLSSFWAAKGGKMAPFAGFSLPVQFEGVVKEHLAVREKCGLFDVSHMGFLEIRGGQALYELEKLLPSSLEKKAPGQALYTALLNEAGGILDDLIVYILDAQHLYMVVNASRKLEDGRWLQAHFRHTEVVLDTRACIFALQGPSSQEILEKVLDCDFSSLYYMHFVKGKIGKWDLFVARTGYTGADGFEIVVQEDLALPLVEELLSHGAVPCGLGARDSLRLEAGYRLYGQDMDETTSPLEAGIAFIIDWQKEFLGKEALVKKKREGIKQRCTGFVLEEAGVPRHGYEIFQDGKLFSHVTSGGYSPLLKRGIGLGYFPPEVRGEMAVLIHQKLRKAHHQEPPFVPLSLYRKKLPKE